MKRSLFSSDRDCAKGEIFRLAERGSPSVFQSIQKVAVLLVVLLGSISLLGLGVKKSYAEESAAAAKKLQVELHPVMGRYGSKCEPTFIAGETIHFSAHISGLSTKPDGDFHFEYEASLIDRNGDTVDSRKETCESSLVFGGDVCPIFLSFTTTLSTPPGQYRLRFQFRDKISNQTVEVEQKYDLLEKTQLRILDTFFCEDSKYSWPTSENTIVGKYVFLRCTVRAPKDKNNEAHLKVTLSAYDQNNRLLYTSKPIVSSKKNLNNGFQINCIFSLIFSKPGLYRLELKATDESTGHVVQQDIPVMAHVPPGMTASQLAHFQEPSTNDVAMPETSNLPTKKELFIDASCTLGVHGSPRDSVFLTGRDKVFQIIVGGLSCDEENFVNYTIDRMLINPTTGATLWSISAHGKAIHCGPPYTIVFPIVSNDGYLKPGDYIDRFIVKDNRTNQTVSQDLRYTILNGNRLGLSCLHLYRDVEGTVFSGPILTVGVRYHLQGYLHVPKEFKEHKVESQIEVLDTNLKPVSKGVVTLVKDTFNDNEVEQSCTGPQFTLSFAPNRPGSYIFRIVLSDRTSGEKVEKEMPIQVFLPPELPASKETRPSFTPNTKKK